MVQAMQKQAIRGRIAHCVRDPGADNDSAALEYFTDGLMLIENGKIVQIGSAAEISAQLGDDIPVQHYTDKLIVPGFIDCHIHYPQLDIIAAYGKQLLDWLNQYTFPAETRFADAEHAQIVADIFLDECLRNGTTSVLAFATIHPESVDAIFSAAQTRRLRLIAGKVLMDRHAPDELTDTPESAYRDSKKLIERWHGQDRLLYAITPRFAPTSTEAQLEQAGQLAQEHNDVYIHTHVAENKKEVAWVSELFPWSRSYLDVYDRYGLLRDRAVYAHCIHLNTADRQRMAATGAAMAFCPTSNLFLGSGLFDLDAAGELGVKVGLATDVGGGTSFNMLRTLSEAYKVLQLNHQVLSPARALYLATQGSAKALHLDDKIGNFTVGKEADFVVLDPQSSPLLARRTEHASNFDELFFPLMMLGDDRAIYATHILGEPVYQAESLSVKRVEYS